jgi:hypothetical protein|tara:strand:+ start:1290 stop:1766 length:477 start_codon:yes stop_codon:yes gene_type:complete
MAITTAMATSFKSELLQGIHNFHNGSGGGTTTTTGTGNTFKIALYTSSATLAASTTAYATTNEVSATGTNYTAGGNTLTNVDPSTSGTTALTDFADTTWSTASLTARGALIYNSSTTAGSANRAVCSLDFGADKTSTSGDFTVQFPAADASNAIIRIA